MRDNIAECRAYAGAQIGCTSDRDGLKRRFRTAVGTYDMNAIRSANIYRRLLTAAIVLQCMWPDYIHPKLIGISFREQNISLAILGIGVIFGISNQLLSVKNWSLAFIIYISSISLAWLINTASVFYSDNFIENLPGYLINELLICTFSFIGGFACMKDSRFIYKLSKTFSLISIFISIPIIIEGISENNLFLPFANASDTDLVIVSYRNGMYRAIGPFVHPIIASEFLIFSMIFSFELLTKPKTLIDRMIGFSAFLLIIIGIYFVNSRTATYVSIFSATIFVFSRSLRTICDKFGVIAYAVSLIIVLSVIAVVGLSLSTISLELGLNGSAADLSSTLARQNMNSIGFAHMFDHPFGFGYRKSIDIVGYIIDGRKSIDNYFLFFGLNCGYIALSFLLLCTSMQILIPFSFANSRKDDGAAPVITSISVAWLLIMVIMANPKLNFIFYILSGAFCAIMVKAQGENAATESAIIT